MHAVTKLAAALLLACAVAAGPAAAQSVVFRADAPEGWYSVPLAGGKVTPLALADATFNYGAHGAAWAPNGKTFLIKPGSATGAFPADMLTAVGAPAGTPVTRLTDGSFGIPWLFSVSPDSRTVAFVGNLATGDQIVAVPLAGGPLTQLTSGETWLNGPSYSPDGQQIAYLRDGVDPVTGAPEGQLAVIPATGGVARVVAGAIANWGYLPSWSPDGRKIAAIDNVTGDVVVVDVATGAKTFLTTGRTCEHARFSPDGTLVTVVCAGSYSGELLLFPASGGSVTLLAADARMWTRGPSWTPDGKGIVYVTDNASGYTGVTRVDLAGVPTELVPTGAYGGLTTAFVQPTVPAATVRIVTATLDYLGNRLVVEATSPRNGADKVTLLGHGAMTWSASKRRWTATVTTATQAWTSVGVCGLDGCVYGY